MRAELLSKTLLLILHRSSSVAVPWPVFLLHGNVEQTMPRRLAIGEAETGVVVSLRASTRHTGSGESWVHVRLYWRVAMALFYQTTTTAVIVNPEETLLLGEARARRVVLFWVIGHAPCI